MNVVHLLESRKKYLIIGILILAVFMVGSIKYGIPAASKVIAYWLPPFALREASDQTIQILDRSVLKVSELQKGRQEQLIRYFEPVIAAHGSYGIKIFFRKGGPIGPNAFAVPDGRIVFTDEMVGIAEHDDELVAVLVHEIGHVVHRHSMRSLIQGSLLGFTLLAITGDVTGSSELFLGLPVLLTELSYSREFEREADNYVLEWLVSHSFHPEHFSNLMLRIEQKKHSMPNQAAKKWLSYLSSHPMTDDRVKRFKREGGYVKNKTDNP
ncbi:MAG: M48 family metallopeptidase [Pseudomonadota bacterium]